MKFPVDLLADVSQADLERSAQSYMNNLVYSDPDSPEQLICGSTKVIIDVGSAGYTPLYGSSDKHKLLGLFPPSDPLITVALYVLDRWWPVEDILKSSDPTREGVLEVKTTGERIVLYILNRIIYRAKEMGSDELPFLCHGENDYAKILWKNGEAIGFYSVKPTGSLCNSFSSRRYELPVMNSFFVRKSQRGKGFGLQMLEDFVQSFEDSCLGLRYPLTKSMYKVCEKYLCQYPEDTDLLWEVEAGGGLKQRSNIANRIQAMNLSIVSKTLSFTEESHVTVEVTKKEVLTEAIATQVEEAQVETYEDVTVLTISKDTDAVPVVTRGRSSGSKQKKIDEKVTNDKSGNVVRIEDIEAEISGEVCEEKKTEVHNVSQTEVISNVVDEKTTAEEDISTLSKIQDSVEDSQELKDGDDISACSTGAEAQDEACLHMITVENVASETREAGKESGEDEEIPLVKVRNESQTNVDSNSEERDIQQDSDEGKTTQTMSVVKVKQKVQSKTPKRRSQRLTMETNSGDRRVLRRRTIETVSTPRKKHTKERKCVHEDIHEEAEESRRLPELPHKVETEGTTGDKVTSESESEEKQNKAETLSTQGIQEQSDDEDQNTKEAVTEEQFAESSATEKQMAENHQAEEKLDETMEEKSTGIPDIEEITSSKGEAPVEEREDVSAIDRSEKEAVAVDPTISETAEDGENSAEVVTTAEPQDGDSDSSAPKPLKSSVVLPEINTSPDVNTEDSSRLPTDEKCDSEEKEEILPSGDQKSETSPVDNTQPESETGEIEQDQSVDENKVDVSDDNVEEVPISENETNMIQEVAADEQSEEEEHVITRTLRKRKKTSISLTRKSKRASRQHKSEGEKEEETTADESTETEETKTMPERSEEQESSEKKAEMKDETETCSDQNRDDRQPEVLTEQVQVVPDVSVPEQKPAEQQHSAVIDTDEQETVSEESAAEDEPPVVTRTLRKGRKSAPAARRKSQRRRKQQQQEDNEKETTPDEEVQVPEESEEHESSEKKVEEKKEEDLQTTPKEDNRDPDVETEQEAEVTDVPVTEQKAVEEEQENTSVNETVEDTTNTDLGQVPVEEDAPDEIQEEAAVEQTEEPVGGTRTLRKRNKTSISPRHKSKRVSAQFQEENNEAASDQSGAEEQTVSLRKGKKSSAAARCKSKRTRIEHQAEEEKEKLSTDEDTEIKQVQTTPNASDKSQKATAHDDEDRNEKNIASPKEDNEVEHVLAMAVISLTGEEEEGQSLVSEGQDNSTEPQLQTELLEAVAVVSLKKQNSGEEEERAAVESCPDEASDSETPEGVVNTDVDTVPTEAKPVESPGVEETTEPVQERLDEQSVYEHVVEVENVKKDQKMDHDTTLENPGKQGHVISSTFDTDEAVQIENVIRDSSEEEVEPIVITKRVLRGRSIPSITITPKRKSKRHSAKIENSEVSFSDEETLPPTSLRKFRKRRSSEATPIHKSKHCSKV